MRASERPGSIVGGGTPRVGGSPCVELCLRVSLFGALDILYTPIAGERPPFRSKRCGLGQPMKRKIAELNEYEFGKSCDKVGEQIIHRVGYADALFTTFYRLRNLFEP